MVIESVASGLLVWEPTRKEIRKKMLKTLDHFLRILEGQVRIEEDERAECSLVKPPMDRRLRLEEPRRDNYAPKVSRSEWVNWPEAKITWGGGEASTTSRGRGSRVISSTSWPWPESFY